MSKTDEKKVRALKTEVEKIINASLCIMDYVQYNSEVYEWASEIRELASKIEDKAIPVT